MCRSKAEGGKRCAYHTNPVMRALYNYKRRQERAGRTMEIDSPTIASTPQRVIDLVGTVITPETYERDDDPFGFETVLEETMGIIAELDRMYPRANYWNEPGHVNYITNKHDNILKDLGLTSADRKLIKRYTQAAATPINRFLNAVDVEEKMSAIEEGDVLSPRVNVLEASATLMKLTTSTYNPTPHYVYRAVKPFHLYRAILGNTLSEKEIFKKAYDETTAEKMVEYVADRIDIGACLEFDGFLSTSVSPRIASDVFKGITLEILTPYGLPVASISRSPEELEVILPPAQRYKIVGVRDVDAQVMQRAYSLSPQKVVSLVTVDEDDRLLGGTRPDVLPKRDNENL